MQSMTTMTTTMMKNVALLFQSLSIVEQQSVAATKNSSMTSADEFPIPSGVGSDWLTMADTLVTRFLSQNEHVLNNDSAVNDAARALKADVKAASLQLDDLRVRHESIIVEARRLLATRVAPCAAFQRVQTLALGKRYEALLTNSKTILSKVLASDGDDDAMIALCDALLRSANLVALSEPIRTRAPRLVALLRERSDAAVEARRVLHTTACRNALRSLGWFASAGSSDDDAAWQLLTRHSLALDRLQSLTKPRVRDGRWSLDALIEPVRQRFRFHFDGERPTNRNDKPEWVYAHVRTLLEEHHAFIARFGGDARQHWIAALVQLAVTRCARTLVELPATGASSGSLLRHVVSETVAFEAELSRIHGYPVVDDDADEWPLPSDAIAQESPPRYAGAMQWHALEHDDVVAAWEAAVDAARPETLRDAPAALMQSVAPSAARATQLSSRSRRIALLNDTLVRGAGMARHALHSIGFARCDAGDVRGATCALDATERLASALSDAATTPLLMNTAPDLLADELSALGATRQALLVSVVQQFLLTPCARAIAPLLRGDTGAPMANALSDLERDLEIVRSACVASQTLRTVVLELCGSLDAYVFDTLWTAQPPLSRDGAAQQLGAELAALVRLMDAFTTPLPARNFMRKLHDLSALFSLSGTERKHFLRDIISRADESLVLGELRAVHVNTLSSDLPKLLIILKWTVKH